MAKVDWITWKTNPEEIINPEAINEIISNKVLEFNNFINNNIYQDIKTEVDKGGLREDALNLNGVSPGSLKSEKVLNKLENIVSSAEELKNTVYSQAQDQKHLEKNQLIEAIEDKIKEQKMILENTENLKNRLVETNDIVSLEEVENTINTTNERIKMLTEKLEKARSI